MSSWATAASSPRHMRWPAIPHSWPWIRPIGLGGSDGAAVKPGCRVGRASEDEGDTTVTDGDAWDAGGADTAGTLQPMITIRMAASGASTTT